LFETLAEGDPQECADRLVELALRGGGPDNVTCIVADVVESGYGDDLPVIGGAFLDQTTPTSTRTDSPAERAALITRAPQPVAVLTRSRRRLPRGPLLLLLLLVLAIAAIFATYTWTQTQYFVGADGDEVAVFRGVDTQFGPLKFFSAEDHTALKVADLTPAARAQVRVGITASGRGDADAIVARRRDDQLPVCGAPGSPTGSTSTPTSGSPTTSDSSSAPNSPPPVSASSSGATSPPAVGTSTNTATNTAGATTSPTPTVSVTPRALPSLIPGVSCRTS
jgi:hypothetical protein